MSSASTPWLSYGKAFTATVLWGCSFIAMRHALDTVPPHAVVWVRNAMGAVFLMVLLRLRGQPVLPGRGDRGRVVLLGLIFGVHLWVQAVALGTTTTMRAGWIIAFVPVVVAIGAALFHGHRLRAIGWLGIALASGGVLVLTAVRPAAFAHAAIGDLLMLASTFTWASYTLLSMGPARRMGGLRVTAGALAISTLPNLAMSVHGGAWPVVGDGGTVAALLFLGLGASGVALWCFTDAVTVLGAGRASAFQYGQPLITMLAAWSMLGEPVTMDLLIGGPLVIAGVWLVQQGR